MSEKKGFSDIHLSHQSTIKPLSTKSPLYILLVCFFALICCTTFLPTCYAADRVINFYVPNEGNLRVKHHTHLFRSQTWYIFRRATEIAFRVQLDS